MAVESQPTELSSLSNMFIDYAEVGEVEVETSEMKPCSNSSNVQPVTLGTFVERARIEDNEVERTEKEVLARSFLNESQLEFIDSLHKVVGHITPEGKFLPNTALKVGEKICFLGDLDAEAAIFVRKSYVTLADIILADFETIDEHRHRGVILGGTPGVGKSTFLAYLLCCCYVQRKFKPQLYKDILLSINVDKPVRLHWDEMRGQYVCLPFSEGRKWIYLFDVLPGSPAPGKSIAYVVAACSPSAKYNAFCKLNIGRLYMPVWSKTELLTCKTVCGTVELEDDTIEMLYKKVGGIARKVLPYKTFGAFEMANLEQYMNEGYDNYSIEDVMEAVEGKMKTQIAHRLIHMKPIEKYMSYKYIYGSPEIRRKYSTVKMTLDVNQVLKYAAKLMDLRAQSMRGFFFEQVARCLFYAGTCVLPLKQLFPNAPSGNQFQYAFNVSNAKLIDGNRIKDDLQDGEYGVGIKNISGIDAVLQPNILFQMTVSRHHKINLPGLVNALLQMNETEKNIYFLFVVPKEVYAQFPYQNIDRMAPSANHKMIHAMQPNITTWEMENYVKQRVRYGVVCVDLDNNEVRTKARAAYSRCNADLLAITIRDIEDETIDIENEQ